MKKAEEYLNEKFPFHKSWGMSHSVLDVIKQAQSEAIDETVKACAEAARCCMWQDDFDGTYECEVNKKSILSVADQLKAKL